MIPISRHRFSAVLTILVVWSWATAQLCLSAPLGDDATLPSSLHEAMARVHAADANKGAVLALYELDRALEMGRIRIDGTDSAAAFTEFLVDLVLDHGPSQLRWKASHLLKTYPHPAAAAAMIKVLNEDDGPGWMIHGNAMAVLTSLQDPRAYPFLESSLQSGSPQLHVEVMGYVADLGDPRGIDLLRPFLSAPRLADVARSAMRRLQQYLDFSIVSSFPLDDYAYRELSDRGFVILPEPKNEMFEHYGSDYPFVTSDVVLHTFLIMHRAAIHELELLVLRPRFTRMLRRLTQDLLEAAAASGRDSQRELLQAGAAFVSVPSLLLEGKDACSDDLPEEWRARVDQEILAINEATSVTESSILGYEEDFRKYRPRGKYAEVPRLSDYYQAMLYLGRMRMLLDDDQHLLQAVCISEVLRDDSDLWAEWQELQSLSRFFFGPLDDLSLEDCQQSVARITGDASRSSRWTRLIDDPNLLEELREDLAGRRTPRINTMLLSPFEYERWPDRSRGVLVLGQRYDPSIDLLQQWIDGDGDFWPPTGLAVAAYLFDSKHAEELISSRAPAIRDVRWEPPSDDIIQSLPRILRPLFRHHQGQPPFMESSAWEEKQINTALGAWAELRHANALYSKDANNYLSSSVMRDGFHGFVEPVPDFYSSLDSLVLRMRDHLEAAGVFSLIRAEIDSVCSGPPPASRDYQAALSRREARARLDRAMLDEFSAILRRLESIARKELAAQSQSIDDGVFLKALRGRLQYLAFNRSGTNTAPTPMSLVSTVATSWQRNEVFQIGVGRPLPIYVAVPFRGKRFVCKGAVYTYHEFRGSIDDELTDPRWRALSRHALDDGPQPWIATRPNLGLRRVLTRNELRALLREKENTGRNISGGREPWRAPKYTDAARHLAGATVRPKDLDLLLALAAQDTLNQGVRAFALRMLCESADNPDVQDFLVREVSDVAAKKDHWNNEDLTRLYFALRGLDRSASQDKPVRERAIAAITQHLEQQHSLRDELLRQAARGGESGNK